MRRGASITALVVALLSLPVAAAAQRAASAADDGTAFVVEPRGGNFAQDSARLAMFFEFGRARAPGRITLYVPRGFELAPNAVAGAPVGFVEAFTQDPLQALDGTVAVAALNSDLLSQAASCSDRAPSDAWIATLSDGDHTLRIPLFVSVVQPGDPPGASSRIDMCTSSFAASAAIQSPIIRELGFSLTFFAAPRAAGNYVWHAIISPLGAGRRGMRMAAAYEARATVPIPQRLTLSGRYVEREHTVVLTGSLRSRGRVRPNAPIEIIRLDREVTEKDVIFRDAPIAVVRTTRSGAYKAKVRGRRTSGFLAYALTADRACGPPQLAPRGCVRNVVSGVESDPVTVSVP